MRRCSRLIGIPSALVPRHHCGTARRPIGCAAYLNGEYGIEGFYIGVPCKLGAAGLEKIIEIKLTPDEKAALDKSAAAVKELVAVIGV